VKLPSLKAEANFVAERLKALHEGGRAWNEMAVIYRSQFIGEEVTQALRQVSIPVEWLQESKKRRQFDVGHDSVKVLTMHSSKGLVFPVVAVPGIGFMPHEKESPEDEARLLYVAMTRAMDQLLLTCHKQSAFSARLERACLKQVA
jgi:superfamily I DNA/RNA helicase